MSNKQFSVQYNGHPVEVTILKENLFMVQVTYKPLLIEQVRNEKGEEQWVEADTQQQTYLTTEIGKIISNKLQVA